MIYKDDNDSLYSQFAKSYNQNYARRLLAAQEEHMLKCAPGLFGGTNYNNSGGSSYMNSGSGCVSDLFAKNIFSKDDYTYPTDMKAYQEYKIKKKVDWIKPSYGDWQGSQDEKDYEEALKEILKENITTVKKDRVNKESPKPKIQEEDNLPRRKIIRPIKKEENNDDKTPD